MSLHRWLLPWSLPMTLSAAIAGVPEAPVPGTLPQAWIAVANDCFGIVPTPDDYRTNQMSLFWRFGTTAIVGVDHSMLTSVPAGIRSDELTLTAGWMPLGAERPWIVVGGGLKLVGNLGGESMQDRWHSVIGMTHYDLAYEKDDPAAVAYALASQVWLFDNWIGAAATGSALATTSGETQAELAGWGVVHTDFASAWIGLRGRYRGGNAPTEVAEEVADFEQGLWVDYGFGAGWFAFSGAYDPIDGVSSGTLTFDLAIP